MQGYFFPSCRSILMVGIVSLCLTAASCTPICNKCHCQKETHLHNSVGEQDFISAVVSSPCGQTNIVYYAGTSNDVFVLVHQTSEACRFWNLTGVNLDKSILRDFSADPCDWIVIKQNEEDTLRYWDWHKEIEDFVQKQSEKSALVMRCSTFYKVDGDLADDNACVWIIDVFSVEATLCDALKNGDKLCTKQLYDGSKEEKHRIISEARHSGNPIVEGRMQDRQLCFAYWDQGKFINPKELPKETFFIIDNELVAPFEVAWNLCYDGLIHFEENVAIQAYKRRVEQARYTHFTEEQRN